MAISNKPYLVRAIYQWCLDCEFTPHVLAGTGYDGFDVPEEYVTDGQIVFNVAPSATRDLEIKNNEITFLANFGQKVVNIKLPIESIIAIYAYENGDGITFDDDDQIDGSGISDFVDVGLSVVDTDRDNFSVTEPSTKQSQKGKPTLTIIK